MNLCSGVLIIWTDEEVSSHFHASHDPANYRKQPLDTLVSPYFTLMTRLILALSRCTEQKVTIILRKAHERETEKGTGLYIL